VPRGAEAAAADFQRYLESEREDLAEVSLRGTADDARAFADSDLAARLRALHDLPAGTLGHEYVEFYRRNGLTLPGDDEHMPAVFVSHDMCHVIGGYEPTGPGEIALGAMQLAVADDDEHWVQFLGNLGVHEAGYLAVNVVPKEGTLNRPGVAAFVARAIRRGEQCTGDFTAADHLALAELPLTEVRARFGVPAPDGDGRGDAGYR
jgi:ubiquinone biosynthesis protein Coq4